MNPAEHPGRLKIPTHLLVIDAIGTLLLALGIWGALAGGGNVLPVLAAPRVSWSLVAIGAVLVLYFVVELIRITLHARRRKGPGGE